MAAITLQDVTKQFGTQVVLEAVSLVLHPAERVGLVGPNGAGKTTLFRIIAQELEPDNGEVGRGRNVQIGYLKQEPDVDLARTLKDEVGSAFADLLKMEHRLLELSAEISGDVAPAQMSELMATYDKLHAKFITAGGHSFEARTNEILGGLGFVQSDHGKQMAMLSGGEKCRAALAKLLLTEQTYLLLDEPTNHLDIDAVRWLEKFLAGHRGGACIVSHDRYLLDRLCDRIIELDRRQVTCYSGNYSTYAQTKAVQQLTQERQFEKDQAFIKKERSFIAQHLAGQRTKEAKGRRTRLNRRLRDGEFVTDDVAHQRTVRLKLATDTEEKGLVLRCDDLSMAFGEQRLFSDLSFQVHGQDRLGITGPNGTGKTTLLRILMAELAPVAGSFAWTGQPDIGYYSQEQFELDLESTPVREILQTGLISEEQRARSYLAQFLFMGESVFKPLGALSGGEQSRLRLAKLLLRKPSILILDEPTNHLDIPSCEVLEEALSDFTGTVIAVSHDRYFLDRCVGRLLVLRPAEHRLVAGNYSTYVEELEAKKSSSEAAKRDEQKQNKRREEKTAKPRSKPSPYDRLSADQLEEMVIEREVELAALHERFGNPAIFKDLDAMAELKEQVESAERDLAEVDRAWQERASS